MSEIQTVPFELRKLAQTQGQDLDSQMIRAHLKAWDIAVREAG